MARERNASSASRHPACGHSFDGHTCDKRGEHFCEPRADHAQAFFEEVLVHTKGRFARQRFILAGWQRDDIVRPLFGNVRWDAELGRYVRTYRIAWIELARKNGKSELLAGIALYLLVADGEESAEIYGAAKDRDQARKVFDVAMRMVQLSPVLSKRLTIKAHEKRIIDERTASYYETVAADAAGNLGHNPHGIIFDEVLTQPSADLWNALRTAMGTREQPMMVAATTAGNDPASFAKVQHDEFERVVHDPGRAPHVFAYMRNMPADADPFDEKNWQFPNPALGDFLSVQALRDEASEAKADPAKENSFRQFRANQWVSQVTRWMPLHLWDQAANVQLVVEQKLHGETAFGGLDLSATTDLTAWALWLPDHNMALFRFWTPEAQVPFLDRHTGGQASVWVRNGFLNVTEGDWIDYEQVHAQIERDKRDFRLVRVGYDQKEATGTAQFMQRLELDIEPVYQGFSLSESLKELMRLVKSGQFGHGAHPVARWCADSVEVKRDDQDRIKVVKPDRGASGKRIDGIAAAANAINVWQHYVSDVRDSAYEDRGLVVL